MDNTKQYELRLRRIEDAIALKEPDTVPLAIRVSGAPYYLYEDIGASHATDFYDFEKSAEAFARYHEEFQPDIRSEPLRLSGKACEIAQPTMIDWPGRLGSPVPVFSTYQVIEHEYLLQDEYDEFLSDHTKFMFKKFLPRMFSGLKSLEQFDPSPVRTLGVSTFSSMFNDEVRETLLKIVDIIDEQKKYDQVANAFTEKLDRMGFPSLSSSSFGIVPYDGLSDSFRGTLGIFEDLIEIPDKIAEANKLLSDVQIKSWKPFEGADMRFKRVFFPLHKGMDGFMSPKQYHELYWEPFQNLLKYLVGIGVTPYIYTEGPYDSRVDYIRERLQELPRGSCFIHFEQGDFAELKKKFSGLACLTGGMPIYLTEYGTKQEVVDRVKYLIDNCAAGGGYLLCGSSAFEKVKRENFEAMFETVRTYGKK